MHPFLAATLGGALVAASTSLNLVLNGEITGMSGLMNGTLTGKPDILYRLSILSSMIAMGCLLHAVSPSLFSPDTAPMLRGSSIFVAGLLVGIGTGIPRLSIRSIVATCTFVLTGGITCSMVYAIPSLHDVVFVSAGEESPAKIDLPNVTPIVATVSVFVLVMVLLRQWRDQQRHEELQQRREQQKPLMGGGDVENGSSGIVGSPSPNNINNSSSNPITPGGSCFGPSPSTGVVTTPLSQLLVGVLVGSLFSCGMVVSGMINQSKVQAFLYPKYPGGWDASLMFVMAAGVGINFFTFRWILNRPSPIIKEKFQVPTVKDLTSRLVVGAAIFGIGWGLAGACPGPVLVDLTLGRASFFMWLAGVGVGMASFNTIEKMF